MTADDVENIEAHGIRPPLAVESEPALAIIRIVDADRNMIAVRTYATEGGRQRGERMFALIAGVMNWAFAQTVPEPVVDPMRERVSVAEKEAALAHRAAAEMRSERDRYIRRVKRLEAALAAIRGIVK